MARNRRYHSSPWVLAPALVLAAGSNAGALALWEATRPEIPPKLIVEIAGEGGAVVNAQPAGISCGDQCIASYEPGTVITLTAFLEEGSTFEGWSDNCVVPGDDVLECQVTVVQTQRVTLLTGLVPEEVEVAWVETPADAEAADDAPPIVVLPEPEIEAEMLLMEVEPLLAEPPPPPEPPRVAAAEPPPEKAEETEPQPPPPPNMRAVEVPDENEVEEAPDDATHLSDKNRDVEVETAATETNLERAQDGEAQASEESDVQSDEVGAEEERIAELDDVEETAIDADPSEQIEKAGNTDDAPRFTAGEGGARGEGGDAGDGTEVTPDNGALAMRGIEGRGSVLREGRGGKKGRRGKEGAPGLKTDLSFEDYERIVGKDTAREERELAQKRISARRGRWEKKLGAVKSALENFTPEVRPGNQTALKTRAAPMALYIARMHRRIHKLWGFGYLEELDGKSASHPLNDWELFVKLEIVVNPDGSIHKINIAQTSGISMFDVAAIDAILTGAPYEEVPAKLRSPDGRLYIHWGFNRNWRQCGTFNAQGFILDKAPEGAESTAMADSDWIRKAPKVGGGRRGGEARGESSGSGGSSDAASKVPREDDPAAVHAANLWITGFTKGDLAKMARVSKAPFSSGDTVVARSPAEISNVYAQVLRESAPLRDFGVLTAGGYRQRYGPIPPGIGDTSGALLLVVKTRDDRLVLVLERQKSGEYLVTGLHR